MSDLERRGDRVAAHELVSVHTFLHGGYKGVTEEDCRKLLGEDVAERLLRDPIRNKGPVEGSVYPWNVVDYMVNPGLREGK